MSQPRASIDSARSAAGEISAPPVVRRKPVPKSPVEPQHQPQQPQPPQMQSATVSFAPHVFVLCTLLALRPFNWAFWWIVSGAPLFVYSILLGASKGHRVLAYLPVWSIIAAVNLAYAVSATSWLLYWVFAGFCYPALILSCLFQFEMSSNLARRLLRNVLRELHFVRDAITLFDLPALELDTDVTGLLVIRGVTLSLSTLTATAHGIEVAVKFPEGIEVAFQVEKVVVSLFRMIEIDDVYANVKGDHEITFGSLEKDAHPAPVEEFMVKDTPILRAATFAAAGGSSIEPTATTASQGLDGSSDYEKVRNSITTLSPDEKKAHAEYEARLRHIHETSPIRIAKEDLQKAIEDEDDDTALNSDTTLRAAICTQLHNQPSIVHPPKSSIRLSTLQHNAHPKFKFFIHRFPFFYRAVLNPISYFHPVKIASITSSGSGKWMASLMQEYFFKHYSTKDGEIRRLEKRITEWLADAHFPVELGKLYCEAQVPMNTTYDIECRFKVEDLLAYRTLPESAKINEVVHLGGADATVSLPSFLLPRHEHLLPPKYTPEQEQELEQAIADEEGSPKAVQLTRDLERLRRDETNMKIAVHGHLPAVFDQELLNFVAALVKATKVIELEKDYEELVMKRAATIAAGGGNGKQANAETASLSDLDLELKRSDTMASDAVSISSTSSEQTMSPNNSSQTSFWKKMDRGFKDMNVNIRDGMRKAGINTVNAMANDRWIASIVGRIMKKLEKAQGDVGYSGNIPISLAEYRERAEPYPKILP